MAVLIFNCKERQRYKVTPHANIRVGHLSPWWLDGAYTHGGAISRRGEWVQQFEAPISSFLMASNKESEEPSTTSARGYLRDQEFHLGTHNRRWNFIILMKHSSRQFQNWLCVFQAAFYRVRMRAIGKFSHIPCRIFIIILISIIAGAFIVANCIYWS
jgi:hypothetical protein